MRRPLNVPKSTILGGSAAVGFFVGLLLVRLVHVGLNAQNSTQAAPSTHVFASDAGIVLNFVKPDKTAEFEAIVGRLRQAMQQSDKPECRTQAARWRVFRATGAGANESVLYVFTMDPAVKRADCTLSTILAEAFPTEVQRLYRDYADTCATGQTFVNLTRVSALGQ